MPAARHLSRSVFMACAVIATRLLAIAGHNDSVSVFLHNAERDALVHQLILRQENAQF